MPLLSRKRSVSKDAFGSTTATQPAVAATRFTIWSERYEVNPIGMRGMPGSHRSASRCVAGNFGGNCYSSDFYNKARSIHCAVCSIAPAPPNRNARLVRAFLFGCRQRSDTPAGGSTKSPGAISDGRRLARAQRGRAPWMARVFPPASIRNVKPPPVAAFAFLRDGRGHTAR